MPPPLPPLPLPPLPAATTTSTAWGQRAASAAPLTGANSAAGARPRRCNIWLYEQAEALFHKVLENVLQLPELTEFRLALPRSMFMPWMQEVLDITLDFDEAIWAKLPAEWLRRRIPAKLIESSKNKAAIAHFWVLIGKSDLPPPTVRCFC
ncbi:hypothetical protein MY11210_006702 [Beauveria gryllotalpidicola]